MVGVVGANDLDMIKADVRLERRCAVFYVLVCEHVLVSILGLTCKKHQAR